MWWVPGGKATMAWWTGDVGDLVCVSIEGDQREVMKTLTLVPLVVYLSNRRRLLEPRRHFFRRLAK